MGLNRYDELGRLTVKHEGSQAVGYYYGSQSHQGYYRPYGMTISGRSYTPYEYYSYDASGNVWLDRYASSAYELDTRALPECVRLYPEVPAGITQDNLENYESSELGRIYMAYDENGQRVYFNYNSGSSNYGDATLSGVGVYHRDGLGMPYSLVRQDLIAGGYRKDGSAYFPVTDVQGNIRGYANTSGVQSAYAYYPYGTLIDLAHDDAEDSRRWQSKEFDSDINKYYFGARFYDPLFGLWLTPDPAGQFANPYTYGGDPLNYIDPNGESITAAIAIGAAVGAAIGASVSAVNCSGANEVGCGKAIAQGVAMGALKGAASAAAGYGAGIAVSGIAEGAGAARTGYAALEMGSSAMSAAAQGAAVQTGIVSGASAWASSVVSSAFDRGNEWYRFDKSFGEDLKNGAIGGLVGVAVGGISGAYQYNTNTAYQWKTHENVLKYALNRYNPENGLGAEYILKSADYVYKVEGGVEQVDFQLQSRGKGLSNYDYEKNLISLDDADINSSSKLYSTVAHEMRHKPLWENTGSVLDWQLEKSFDTEKYATALGTQEKIINRELMSHKYFRFWDLSRQIEIKTNYIRYKDFHDARFDLQY